MESRRLFENETDVHMSYGIAWTAYCHFAAFYLENLSAHFELRFSFLLRGFCFQYKKTIHTCLV